MSAFPQSVWHPTPKDIAADFNPEQLFRFGSVPAAAVGVQFRLFSPAFGSAPIPPDKVVFITNVQYQGVPGAGQSVTRINLRWGVDDNVGAFVPYGALDTSDTFAAAAGFQRNRTWSAGTPGFPMLAGQVLAVDGNFDAGAVANAVAINVVGIVIPRGNWQRT